MNYQLAFLWWRPTHTQWWDSTALLRNTPKCINSVTNGQRRNDTSHRMVKDFRDIWHQQHEIEVRSPCARATSARFKSAVSNKNMVVTVFFILILLSLPSLVFSLPETTAEWIRLDSILKFLLFRYSVMLCIIYDSFCLVRGDLISTLNCS